MYVVPMILGLRGLLGLAGCFGGDEAPAPEPEAKPAAPEPEPEPEERSAYVIGETILRKIASDEKKIDDPNGGGKVSNWVATLYRGEAVTIIGEDGDWTQIRASDNSEGWLKADRMVAADHPVATVYEPGKVFQRPDLLTLDTTRKIEPGALVFVVQEKDQFSEIDFPRSGYNSSRAWTLTNELVSTPEEVDLAKLIMKVQHLRAKNDPSAAELEELARSQFGGSRLLVLLDVPAPPPVEGDPAATPPEVPPAAPVVP